MEAVPAFDFPVDYTVLFDQHGSLRKELPDGIRPDHGFDKRRPAQSTESISYLIYNNGMSGGQFGFQSANAVVFFIVIVIVSVAQMKFSSSKEEQL